MKKLLALLMALVFVFSFAACGSEDTKGGETTTAVPTTVPASPADAKKAVENFFDKLDTKTILELNGEDTSALTEEKELYVIVLDAIVLNSKYEILSTDKKDDTTYNVKVKISVPDSEAAMEIIAEAVEILDEQYPDVTKEEGIKILKELFKQGFADPGIDKISTETTVTVKIVNGKCTVDSSDEFASELVDIFFATLLDM